MARLAIYTTLPVAIIPRLLRVYTRLRPRDDLACEYCKAYAECLDVVIFLMDVRPVYAII